MNDDDRCNGLMRLNGTKLGMCHTCGRHTYHSTTVEPPVRQVSGVWECEAWKPHPAPPQLIKSITLEEK